MNLFRNVLFWIVLALVGALLAQVLMTDPGYVLVRFRGSDYTTTVASGVMILLGVLAVAWLLWTVLTLPFRSWRRPPRPPRAGPPGRRLAGAAPWPLRPRRQLLDQAAADSNGDEDIQPPPGWRRRARRAPAATPLPRIAISTRSVTAMPPHARSPARNWPWPNTARPMHWSRSTCPPRNRCRHAGWSCAHARLPRRAIRAGLWTATGEDGETDEREEGVQIIGRKEWYFIRGGGG
jgi:hypothetical protein